MQPLDPQFLKDVLRTAGSLAFGQRGQHTAQWKPDRSPVTVVDKQVEAFLIERITARYPDHQILSEESGLHPQPSAYTWVIDPIDGTRAFAAGLPIWGILAGVLHEGKPLLGGFYMPVTGEYYGSDGTQFFYNDRVLPLPPAPRLEDALLFLAVSSEFHHTYRIAYPRVRSLGSTAAHLAYLASGAAVGVLMPHVSLWDLVGMLPLLHATGMTIEYLNGAPFDPTALMDGQPVKSALLASSPALLSHLREQIQLL